MFLGKPIKAEFPTKKQLWHFLKLGKGSWPFGKLSYIECIAQPSCPIILHMAKVLVRVKLGDYVFDYYEYKWAKEEGQYSYVYIGRDPHPEVKGKGIYSNW